MKVLIACEFSGVVRRTFRDRGHDAWSCDLLPAEDGDAHHLQDDALRHLKREWDLIIAHPPCTYLTNAGVRHLHSVPSRNGIICKVHGEARWEAMREAATFFNQLQMAPCPRIAVENPIPHRYAREIIGTYTQLIQPWQFGHGEVKATCLWLKGLPKLLPTNVVDGRLARVHKMSPGPNRWKERSRTFQGIADAMAQQWGDVSL
jgi:hypothetical protein